MQPIEQNKKSETQPATIIGTFESASTGDLVKSLHHPDRLVRLLVMGTLFDRGYRDSQAAVDSVEPLCGFIRNSTEPMERGCAGVLLCMACAAIPPELWNSEIASMTKSALRDHLKLNGERLEELRFPAAWSTTNEIADVLLKLRLTPLVNVSVPYWVGQALQTDETSLSTLNLKKDILRGWGELGECGLKVLQQFQF